MVATSLCVLPSQVRAMPLPDLFGLFDHWANYPPTHILLSAFVDYQPQLRQATNPESMDGQERAELFSMMGAPAPLPPHLRELIQQTEAMKVKMGMA
jgi:hypothetical protein